jgi:hypothetical protein
MRAQRHRDRTPAGKRAARPTARGPAPEAAAITDGLIFMAVPTPVTRTVGLTIRARTLPGGATSSAGSFTPTTATVSTRADRAPRSARTDLGGSRCPRRGDAASPVAGTSRYSTR